jgi:hypothetical protein
MAVYELKLFQPPLQPKRLHAHFTHSLKVPSRNHSPFCTCHLTTARGASTPTGRKEGSVLGQRRTTELWRAFLSRRCRL